MLQNSQCLACFFYFIVHSPLFVAYLHVHMSFLGELGHLICPLIYGRIFPQILGKHQIFPQFQ